MRMYLTPDLPLQGFGRTEEEHLCGGAVSNPRHIPGQYSPYPLQRPQHAQEISQAGAVHLDSSSPTPMLILLSRLPVQSEVCATVSQLVGHY